MKIQFQTPYLNNISSVFQTRKKTNSTCPFLFKNECDTVELSFKRKAEPTKTPEEIFDDFATRTGRVTLDDYKKLKEECPEAIELAKKYFKGDIFNDENFNPKLIAKTAHNFKEYFDSKFKEGYQLISIGTSPATICEAMEALGCNISYMPITNARFWLPEINQRNYNEVLLKFPNLRKSLKYVKNQNNLDEFNKRKTLIMDFCSSGATLKKIGAILVNYFNIPLERVNFIDLFETFDEINTHKELNLKEISKDERRKLIQYTTNTWISELSNVPHFLIDNNKHDKDDDSTEARLRVIDGNFKSFTNPTARIFMLCVIDELQNLE